MTAGSEIPAGSVVITPQDMWDAIGRIEAATNEIKSTIAPQVVDLRASHDALERAVEQNKADHKQEIDDLRKDHEARIRTVERANWKQAGIYTAITIATGLVELWYYVTHH